MSHPHILYVEDDAAVRLTIADTLEIEGWRVETCADGMLALRLIEGDARFDLLLLDNELPGLGGLELTRRARTLAHRRRTPIVMISASECGRAARRAGADAFIRKPQDVGRLVEIITRLLGASVDERGGGAVG